MISAEEQGRLKHVSHSLLHFLWGAVIVGYQSTYLRKLHLMEVFGMSSWKAQVNCFLPAPNDGWPIKVTGDAIEDAKILQRKNSIAQNIASGASVYEVTPVYKVAEVEETVLPLGDEKTESSEAKLTSVPSGEAETTVTGICDVGEGVTATEAVPPGAESLSVHCTEIEEEKLLKRLQPQLALIGRTIEPGTNKLRDIPYEEPDDSSSITIVS